MVAALALSGSARAVEPLTLDRALDLAFVKNPELLSTRQELTVAEGRLEKARYWNQFNPQITGGAADRHFGGGGSAIEPLGEVSLEVEVAGQRSKRIEEAERNLERVSAAVAEAERQLRATVADAFYRALYLGRRHELLQEVEKLTRRLRDAAVERFKAGEVAKLEANLAAVRYGKARREALASERDRQNAIVDLERLVGNAPSGATEIAGDLSMKSAEVDEKSLLDSALRARPDLREREAEVTRVDAETALTRRLIVPNPTFRATYDEDAGGEGTSDRIFGGAVTIPLPLFDRKQADLTALAGLRSKALHERDGARLAVESDVRQALAAYRAAREGVAVFESEAVASIRESFAFIETAYRQGKLDLLQLVVVQNDLVSAELSYLDSLQDLWAARVALERAVGQPIETGDEP